MINKDIESVLKLFIFSSNFGNILKYWTFHTTKSVFFSSNNYRLNFISKLLPKILHKIVSEL